MANEQTPAQTDSRDVAPPTEMEEHIQTSQTSAAGPSNATDTGTSPERREASASPGKGYDVPADQIKKLSEASQDDPELNVVQLPPRSPTFKEQVYGYARLIRGTVLGQPDVKEQGTQVLRGQQTIPLRRGSQSSK